MPLFCFDHLRISDLQMRDIQMPLGSIGNKNIAVRPMRVSDFVNFDVRRQNVHYYRLVQRNYAGAEFFASYELTLRRIHREKITFHPNEIAFMAFHSTDEMTLRVILEELTMDNVNVFPNINDHKLIDLCFAFPRGGPVFRFEKVTNSNDSPSHCSIKKARSTRISRNPEDATVRRRDQILNS
jgi:hypothetical protein